MKFPRLTLKRANNILFALIVVINSYVIAAPIWPRIDFWWRTHHSNSQALLTQIVHKDPTTSSPTQPAVNSLIIPALVLQQPTLEAPKSDWFNVLKQGIWRWPDSSTPDKGGNTVFLAHRFSYTGRMAHSYFLDKLKIGDEIGVIWGGKNYVYTVISSREVPPTETSIENNTPDARITLFTCTPLWHPVNRLVVVATLKEHP